MREWAVSLMERDNRKSHLAPLPSPGTRELLLGNHSPDGAADDRALETPTSGEIPIVGAIVSSPRDQHNSVSNRSPTRSDRGGAGSGRSNGPFVHPGLGPRVATTNSIPQLAAPPMPRTGRHSPSPSLGSNSSKQSASFALPIRPPPPGGPLPPPPPRRNTPQQTPDDANVTGSPSRGMRRQATFGLPQGQMNTSGMGYSPANQVRRE